MDGRAQVEDSMKGMPVAPLCELGSDLGSSVTQSPSCRLTGGRFHVQAGMGARGGVSAGSLRTRIESCRIDVLILAAVLFRELPEEAVLSLIGATFEFDHINTGRSIVASNLGELLGA